MTTTTASSSSSSSPPCTNLYNTPVFDAVCAMQYGLPQIEIMKKCCRNADIVSYYNDCGLYCSAQGQSVADLSNCFYKEGAKWQDVFCRGNDSDTSTATRNAKIPAAASASVVAGGYSSNTKDRPAASSSSSGAASPPSLQGIDKVCVAIGALVVSSTIFGVLQI